MRRLVVLVVLALTGSALLVSSPAQAATRYSVTSSVSRTTVDVGQSVVLKGKVRPKAKGQKVLVQRFTGARWVTVKRDRLNKRSRYSASVRITAPGENLFRVVKRRSNGHPKGVSPTQAVTAWRWRAVSTLPLSTHPGHETYGTTHQSTGILNGTSYAPFIKTASDGAGGNGYYRLDGQCTRLDTHVGGSHDSVTPQEGSAFILASRTSNPATITDLLFLGVVSRGSDPYHVVRGPADMSTVAVLELRSSGGDPGDRVGWGAARVYCKS